MVKYRLNDFKIISDFIVNELKYERSIPHEEVHEFSIITNEQPFRFLRLIYDKEHTQVVLSFAINANVNDAILTFSRLWNTYRNLVLTDGFYVNYDQETFMGTEAETAYFEDVEQEILNNIEYISEEPPEKELLKEREVEDFKNDVISLKDTKVKKIMQ